MPYDRIHELRTQLHRHNRLYHTEGKTEITDAQFDTLLRELEQLEKRCPELADPNSPTARVGGSPFADFPEFKHRVKMLSLDKVFNIQDLAKWCATHGADVAVEPKIDGLSLSLHYAAGSLERAVTRGDGTVGAECTANARAIASIPLCLPSDFTGEVRGEVYMSKASFAENNRVLAALGEDEMANPRNAAAGTFKSLDPKVVAERKLAFVAYEVIPKAMDWEGTQIFLKSQGFVTTGDLLARAKLTGMTVSGEGHAVSLSQLLTKWETALEKLEVETDGAVIKVCSVRLAQELGAGTKTVKWAIAYKFPPKQVSTELLDIELTVGRTGIVVPNARLKPVQIAGTTVSNASLCNQDEVERLGIRVGDTVWVQKSGEIIPKVVGVRYTLDGEGAPVPEYGSPDAKARAWKFPKTYIDSRTGQARVAHPLVREAGASHYRLANPDACFDCRHAQLVHATSKLALDWDGCGPAQIDVLMKNGVMTVDQLFVTTYGQGLEGKAAENFLASREEVKRRPLWRFLRALCSDGIGATYCKQLGSLFRNWRAVLAVPQWRLEELMGPVKAAAFLSSVPTLRTAFERLETLGCILDDDKLGATGPQTLQGLVFCVTGTLTKGRDEIQALIEAAGGLAKSGVTKATNYLVVGEDAGGSKLKAAEKHGTKQITEAELYELIQKS